MLNSTNDELNVATILLSENDQQTQLINSVAERNDEIVYIATATGELKYLNRKAQDYFRMEVKLSAVNTIFQLHPDLSPERWDNAIKTARAHGRWTLRTEQNQQNNTSEHVELHIESHNNRSEEWFVCTSVKIGQQNWSDQLLELIAEAASAQTGERFFKTLMRNMATAFEVKHAFITECLDDPATRVRMLAFWSGNDFADNMEYDLSGTPCDQTIHDATLVLHKKSLGELFPKEKGFAESYLGVPVFDAEKSRVIGHIAFLDDKPMRDERLTCAAFDIFTSRASAELQRLRAERSLRTSERNYRLLVENQTDLILKLDEENRLLFASPSFCATVGQTENKVLGSLFTDYFQEEEQHLVLNALQSVFDTSQPLMIETRTRTQHGWCWFNWSLKSMASDSPEIEQIIAVGRDITERRQAEEQAQKHMQQLAHVGRLHSLGEMAAGLAHELNQPLTAIMSFANASNRVLRPHETQQPEVAHALDRIIANADRAGEIIRQMRGFVKKGESRKVPVDINRLILEVIQLINVELRYGEIVLIKYLKEKLPVINADPMQIQQVLVNLLRNAIEALVGSHSSKRRIDISSCLTENAVEVSVHDNGPGIPPEIADRLFQTFISSKEHGLGIGLPICESIIQAHGGRLTGANHPQKGAIFQFFLPIVTEEE